jgi:hypothetical protein
VPFAPGAMAFLAVRFRSRLRCRRALVCPAILLETCATLIGSGRLFVMFASVARARRFVVL